MAVAVDRQRERPIDADEILRIDPVPWHWREVGGGVFVNDHARVAVRIEAGRLFILPTRSKPYAKKRG